MASSISGRPLYANPRDQEFYVGLEDTVVKLERAVARGLNCLVIGQRGSGKTSLMHHLLYRAGQAAPRPPMVYVDASIARSAVDVVDLVREQLNVPADLGENVRMGLRALAQPATAATRESALMLQRLAPLREIDETVVLLDGLLNTEMAHTLFGRLRDELWAMPLTWVVTAEPHQRSGFLTPPADAFFETVVTLRSLDTAEQLELLRRRLPREWRKVTPLVGEERGNPRQLLSGARDILVDGRPAKEILRAAVAQRKRVSALGQSASAMFAELEALGRPVAASDTELLARVGVTRERASQVLNQLQAAGLLESFSEPAERGRPRKLYRIRDVDPSGAESAG